MSGPSDRDRRRKLAAAFSGLRDLRIELAVLNHRVGTRIRLRDLDFDCLDVIARHGPISPSALAGRLGVHLATMTGVLNRLEQGGWVTRDRVPGDRRAVVLTSPADRQRDILGLLVEEYVATGQPVGSRTLGTPSARRRNTPRRTSTRPAPGCLRGSRPARFEDQAFRGR